MVLCQLDEWGERDTAHTALCTVEFGKYLLSLGSIQRLEIGYDCIGVGAMNPSLKKRGDIDLLDLISRRARRLVKLIDF